MNDTNNTGATPDPLTQAGELLLRLHRRLGITGGGLDRDAAVVIAGVGYAQAVELRRIGDLLEGLCEASHRNGLAADQVAADLVAIVTAHKSEGGRRDN